MTDEAATLIEYITRMLRRASWEKLCVVYEFVLALTTPEGDAVL